MIEIEQLITDLKIAKEGSMALGDRVVSALGCEPIRESGHSDDPNGAETWWAVLHPNPTQSVDAALALVPDGLRWVLEKFSENYAGKTDFRAEIMENRIPIDEPPGTGSKGYGVASTPALALCIAVLEAN